MKQNIDILIVEDSKTQAENLRYILESNNFAVQHAIDAEKALEMLDLLFSSYEMSVNKNKELQLANDKLKIMHSELEELVETKDKLFNIIAHDLKNNFNPLRGLSEILATDVTSYPIEEISKMAKVLHESFNKQYQLLDNLLQWVRIQKGQSIKNPATISLKKIVQETTILLKQNLLKKNIYVELDIQPRLELFADENMLNTIFRNLVGNAIKFSFYNGTIKIVASKKDNITKVEIIDYGTGIEKDLIAKLFNTREFISRVGTENESGSGFGLILCKDFIEKHDGTIQIESDPDRRVSGTKVSFTLVDSGAKLGQ